MSTSSEHEFEGQVSVELSGDIFGIRHVRGLENLDDVQENQLGLFLQLTIYNIILY